MAAVTHQVLLGAYSWALAPTAFVHQANFNTSGETITIPTVVDGDFGIIHFHGGSLSSTPGSTHGWTRVSSDTSTVVWAKRLRAADSGAVLTLGTAGAVQTRGQGFIFRPDGAGWQHFFKPRQWTSNSTNVDPVAQSVEGTDLTGPCIQIAGYAATAAVSPRTSSGGTPTEVQGTDNHQYMKYWLTSAGGTPADLSVDMDDEGSNALVSGSIVFDDFSADAVATRSFLSDAAGNVSVSAGATKDDSNLGYLLITGDADGGTVRISGLPVLNGQTVHICLDIEFAASAASISETANYGGGASGTAESQAQFVTVNPDVRQLWMWTCTGGAGGYFEIGGLGAIGYRIRAIAVFT